MTAILSYPKIIYGGQNQAKRNRQRNSTGKTCECFVLNAFLLVQTVNVSFLDVIMPDHMKHFVIHQETSTEMRFLFLITDCSYFIFLTAVLDTFLWYAPTRCSSWPLSSSRPLTMANWPTEIPQILGRRCVFMWIPDW